MAKYLLLILLSVSSLFAHEHWLYIEDKPLAEGDTLKLILRSGHGFKESEFAVNTQFIKDARLLTPSGNIQELIFVREGLEHWAEVTLGESGCYTVTLSLRKRPAGSNNYLVKSIFVVPSDTLFCAPEPGGQDIEIEFISETINLSQGSSLSLQVVAGDEKLKVPMSIAPPGGKTFSLSINRDGIAELDLRETGLYTVSAHYRRQGCSLTFKVNPK